MSDLEGLKLIPPLQVPPEQFPESEELPEGVKTVAWKDAYGLGWNFFRMWCMPTGEALTCISRSWCPNQGRSRIGNGR